MSPQFVDFDADGHLDIVAGTYDGSPHVSRGSPKGWLPVEQILDRDGARIVCNQFWNFDTSKWENTTRCDPPGSKTGSGRGGHLTSAVAIDLDADGDLDLLLGDHSSGRIFRRTNEGTKEKAAFATKNEPVLAGGAPIDVPGTVATMRLVDWNKDGRVDLACGGMGDAYGSEPGGGVYLFVDTAREGAPSFAAPVVLLEPSKKGTATPVRPDSGIYMDFADHDGDGDLDMVVGGYSHWHPPARTLTADEERRAKELQAELTSLDLEQATVLKSVDESVKGLSLAEAEKARKAALAKKQPDLAAIGKKRQGATKELDALVPGDKRQSWVWLYENTGARAEPDAPKPR